MADISKAPEALDGGWAWVVVSASFLEISWMAGYLKGLGVLLVEWQLFFDVGAKEVSWIVVAVGTIAYSGGIVGTSLSSRYGTRLTVIAGGVIIIVSLQVTSLATTLWQLYVTNSFVGLGIAIAFYPSVTVMGFYFDKRIGIANGIAFSGTGLGVLIFPPFFQLLMETFGWRRALQIYGGCSFLVCACGFLLKPSRREKYWMRKETKKRRHSLKQQGELLQPSFRLMKVSNGESQSCLKTAKLSYSCLEYFGFHLLVDNKDFIYLTISFVIATIGSLACLMYFSARAVFDVGLSQIQGSYTLSAMGVGTFIGRACHGILLDWKWTTPSVMYILTSFVTGIILVLYPFSHCLVSLLLCTFVFGLSNGPFPSLQLMIFRDILSPGEVGASFSLVYFFHGFSNTLGVYIMAYMFDMTGNYDMSFFFAGGTVVMSGILILFRNLHQYHMTKRHSTRVPVEIQHTQPDEKVVEETEEVVMVEQHHQQQEEEEYPVVRKEKKDFKLTLEGNKIYKVSKEDETIVDVHY